MQGPFINRQTLAQRLKQIFAPVLVALATAAKWVPVVLKFALPLLKVGGTMFISLFFYSMYYGWRFAAGFVLLIFVHEMGHLIAARIMGLKVGLPVFIPFMGALIALKEAPRNAWIEAVVGIGGPLLGSFGALLSVFCYYFTGHPLFLLLGYVGFMLNLFNLIPVVPLDGGRIVTAVSPWLWLVGIVILVTFFIQHPSGVGIFIFLMVILSLPRLLALFRRRNPAEMRYFECSPAQRWIMGALYFGLAISLLGGMEFVRAQMGPRAF